MAHIGVNRTACSGATVASALTMPAIEFTFEAWKQRLRLDCELQNKVLAYDNLGEECLKLLWEVGTEPSVQGIIDGCAKAA